MAQTGRKSTELDSRLTLVPTLHYRGKPVIDRATTYRRASIVWKKKENESPTSLPATPSEPPRTPSAPRRADRAVIGPTLRIRGEVSGEEELIVQGQVDGKVVVKGQGVTVGKSGKVRANIHARSIRVEGEVRGDLFGEQEVIIEASGDVEGNLIAPSVRLENGSRFKGSIDMESAKQPAARPMVPPAGAPGAAPKPPQPTGDDSSSKPTPPAPGQPPLRP